MGDMMGKYLEIYNKNVLFKNDIVFMYGFFDLISAKTVKLFNKFKDENYYIVLGVYNDAIDNIYSPINLFTDRLLVLENIEFVDYVFAIKNRIDIDYFINLSKPKFILSNKEIIDDVSSKLHYSYK